MPFPTLSDVFPYCPMFFPTSCLSLRTSAHLLEPPLTFPHLRPSSRTFGHFPAPPTSALCAPTFSLKALALYMLSDYSPELSHASDTQPDDATCIPPPFHPFSVMPYSVSAPPQFYVCTRHLNIVPVQHIYTPDLSSVFPLSLIINYDQLCSSTSPPPNFLSAPLPETSSDVFSF
jgi:hypothetical protein